MLSEVPSTSIETKTPIVSLGHRTQPLRAVAHPSVSQERAAAALTSTWSLSWRITAPACPCHAFLRVCERTHTPTAEYLHTCTHTCTHTSRPVMCFSLEGMTHDGHYSRQLPLSRAQRPQQLTSASEQRSGSTSTMRGIASMQREAGVTQPPRFWLTRSQRSSLRRRLCWLRPRGRASQSASPMPAGRSREGETKGREQKGGEGREVAEKMQNCSDGTCEGAAPMTVPAVNHSFNPKRRLMVTIPNAMHLQLTVCLVVAQGLHTQLHTCAYLYRCCSFGNKCLHLVTNLGGTAEQFQTMK